MKHQRSGAEGRRERKARESSGQLRRLARRIEEESAEEKRVQRRECRALLLPEAVKEDIALLEAKWKRGGK